LFLLGIQLLPQCDKIAIMDGGKMVYFGPFSMQAINQYMPSSTNALLETAAKSGNTAIPTPRKSLEKRRPKSSKHLDGVVIPGEDSSCLTGFRYPMLLSMRKWWLEGGLWIGILSLGMCFLCLGNPTP
jgi:hypothetical protein